MAIEANNAGPEKVVVGPKREKQAKYEIRDAEATAAWLIIVIGAAFAIVGLVDLTLLWTPLRFGDPAWEFTTLSRTFTNVPLTGLGLLFVAIGLVRHPSDRATLVRVAAAVFAALTIVLAVLGVLYVTVSFAVLRQTSIEGLDAVGSTIVKNGAEIVAYTTAFALVSVLLWRGVRRIT